MISLQHKGRINVSSTLSCQKIYKYSGFLRDQITLLKPLLELLFAVTSMKHNKDREWKITKPFNACFDFHGTTNGTTETVIFLISPQNYISDAEQCVGGKVKLLEVGECALKIYWKANIIKNFFYCILHASFQSLVRCRSVVDSSIMETSSNICCAIVNAFLFYFSPIVVYFDYPHEPSGTETSRFEFRILIHGIAFL